MTRNEAAERLRSTLGIQRDGQRRYGDLLDEALATERSAGYAEGVAAGTRLTVERVREALESQIGGMGPDWKFVHRILDDLATADVDEEAGNG